MIPYKSESVKQLKKEEWKQHEHKYDFMVIWNFIV